MSHASHRNSDSQSPDAGPGNRSRLNESPQQLNCARDLTMKSTRQTAEQIIRKLTTAEQLIAKCKTVADVCSFLS